MLDNFMERGRIVLREIETHCYPALRAARLRGDDVHQETVWAILRGVSARDVAAALVFLTSIDPDAVEHGAAEVGEDTDGAGDVLVWAIAHREIMCAPTAATELRTDVCVECGGALTWEPFLATWFHDGDGGAHDGQPKGGA